MNRNSVKRKERGYKRIILVLLVGAMLFGSISCAPAQSTVDDGEEPGIALPTATPAPSPVSGGELRLPMPTNADITNPLTVNTEEMLAFFSLIYEGLLSIDSSGRLNPGLAEVWSADEETGRVWTFKLRAAARWHDTAERVSAEDVVATYQRIVSLGASSYYSYVTSRVASMQAGEDGSLIVTMLRPGLASLYALTFPVLRGGTPEENGFPVGTGPYSVRAATDETVRLSANQNWWKQTPYIESVTFSARDSNDIALASYEASQLDMVPTSAISVGRYRDEGVTNVLDIMTQTAETLVLNYSNENLRDIQVRMALAYAIDRSSIITNVYMNRAQACDVPVAPDSWLYESRSKIYDYNTTVALSLLADAGWADTDDDGYLEKDGQRYTELTLRLLVNDSTDTSRRNASDMIVSQLENIGIHVELETAAYSLGTGGEYIERIQQRDFDLLLIGFNLGRDLDLTPYVLQTGANNYGGYSNAAVERLAENILIAADEATLRGAASEFQMRFVQELPFITLYFRLHSILYSNDIKGLSDVREPDILQSINQWYMKTDVE